MKRTVTKGEEPMTLTLDLSSDTEARLREEAARRGLQVEELALQLLESSFQPIRGAADLTDEEFDALLDEMSEGMDPKQPPLSDEAISRAGFYDERR